MARSQDREPLHVDPKWRWPDDFALPPHLLRIHRAGVVVRHIGDPEVTRRLESDGFGLAR